MPTCPVCGLNNEPDSLFCISCGTPLGQSNAGSPGNFVNADVFQPVSPAAAQDAFAMDAGVVAPIPQDTIDIYAAAARVSDEAEQLSMADAVQQSSGPAHAAQDYDDSADVLTALEDLDERLSTLESLVKERASAVEGSIGKLSEQFDGKISRNEHEAAVLKSMSDEMQEYRDGLYAKLTKPLVRDIIDAREALGMALSRSASATGGGGDLSRDVELCRDMLADSLMRNGVEIVSTSEGDDFESFKHKIVGKVHTSESALHGKIAEVSGDSYRMDEQFISPAMVKVYTVDEVSE